MKRRRGVVGDFLEPITRKAKKREFLAVDIESKDGDAQRPGFTRPFLAGMFDPKTLEYQEFRDEPHLRERAWETRHIMPGGCIDKLLTVLLTKKYSKRIFYAHNGGSFDWLFMLGWLRLHEDDYEFEVIPVQSSIQMLRVRKRSEDPEKPSKLSWDFLDSMKLLPMGLDKACRSFGLPGKVEHDLAMHEDDPRWTDYLRQDCVALATVMTRFYDLVDRLGGEVGITAASTAMKLYRRRFLGKDDTPERVHRWRHWPDCRNPNTCGGCAHAWVRRGYYGGRTEIFRTEGQDLHYFDINSSYVAAMRFPMPIGDRVIEEGRLDWRKHQSRGGRYSGFCECTVYVPPTCPVPPLPHRAAKTRKLIFPVGRFHGVWSLEELALLEDPIVGGRIEHVTRTVWFRLRPMFQAMVDELWKLRNPQCEECRPAMQAAGDKHPCSHFDEGLSLLAKLLGNSTYGKFAMKEERTTIVIEKRAPRGGGSCMLCGEAASSDGGAGYLAFCSACEGSKPATGDAEGDVWYQKKVTDAPYIIPHIAAHITALARVRLWRYMRTAVTTPGGQEVSATLEPGSVIFGPGVSGAALVLEVIRGKTGGYRARARLLDEAEMGREIEILLGSEIRVGGKLFYLDTDSCITDVMLPTGTRLGEMKDEYPNDKLGFLAVQPKCYWLERQSDGKKKVTMKGFDQALRTPENLLRLKNREKIDRLPSGERWRRLEKVRSLAAEAFRRPPRMREVEKSFRTDYDKRHVLSDGIGTKAVVLDEPVGGYGEFDAAAE